MSTTVTSNMPAVVNLNVYRGDTWSQQFRFLNEDQPLDLTGLGLLAAARSSTGDFTDLVVTVVGNPTEGTIQLELPPGGLLPDLYDYDIEITDQGAVTTWIRGRLKLERDVTNEQP